MPQKKQKRRRIFKEVILQGEIVAKSYVNMDFRKCISAQIVHYSNLSHKIELMQIVIR
jgi:hypothetical protein